MGGQHSLTGGQRRRSRSLIALISDWGIVVPFVLAIGVLLIGPVINIALDSLHSRGGGFTLTNWIDVFRAPLTRRAILSSIVLGLTVATLSTIIGAPLAWCISRLSIGGRSLAIAALNVAANISATSLVFGFAATFGGAGLVTLALRELWLDAPTMDLYSTTGLVIVYLYFHVPLFVLIVLPAMGAVSEPLWEAAAVCGARPRLFWWRIGLPILAPFFLAGWILMFVWAIGAYGVPLALGGTDGRIELITLRIGALVQSVGSTNRFERAACLSVLLIVLSIGALWLYQTALRRGLKWLR
jgi:putative spermidine/putrescine transport system permease protein